MLIKIIKQSFGMFCILFLFVIKSHAQEVLPTGCVAVVIKDEMVNLKTNKSMYIFIHNLSENDVWLINQIEKDNLQSTLSSKMAAGAWSALVVNQEAKKLKFSCIESKPGHEQRISCQDVLAICQWPNTKIPEDNKGVFFVAESMDLSALSAYSERNGYSLS